MYKLKNIFITLLSITLFSNNAHSLPANPWTEASLENNIAPTNNTNPPTLSVEQNNNITTTMPETTSYQHRIVRPKKINGQKLKMSKEQYDSYNSKSSKKLSAHKDTKSKSKSSFSEKINQIIDKSIVQFKKSIDGIKKTITK